MRASASEPTHSLLDETLITAAQAAKRIPGTRGADRVNPATVWRWMTSGIELPSGKRLRLESIRCGHGWRSSVEALQRFFDALTAASMPATAAPTASAPLRSPAKRRRASERAERELEAAGVR